MILAIIITLRESLEALLIIAIIISYLVKTKNEKLSKFIYYGAGIGILFSLFLALIFEKYLGGFSGSKEQLYEGVFMLATGGLLSWMIIWMINQKNSLKKQIEDKVQKHISNNHIVGLFFLSFIGVTREGIETVLFLNSAVLQSNGQSVLIGGVLGIIIAGFLALLFYKKIKSIPLVKFFNFASLLLIFFAAGLFAHGIHELQELGIVPIIIEHVWDINPSIVSEGVYPLLHENGVIGEFFKGLFGYNGNPSLIEIVTYFGSLSFLLYIFGKQR